MKTKSEFTREQYLNKECSHEQYYDQFVNKQVKDIVRAKIGTNRIKQSKDMHFNDIPLAVWSDVFGEDYVFEFGDQKGLKGTASVTRVCIAKEAARQIQLEA